MTQGERNAYVRDKCWTYWGRPPTPQEQAMLAGLIESKDVDAALTVITDSPNHATFRDKRGW